MKRTLLAACTAAAMMASASSSDAFVRAESNWDPTTLPISYGINLSTAPSEIGASGAQSAVEAAFASWSAPACTSWRSHDAGNTTRTANTSDRQNTILWVSGSWPATLGDVNTTIGVTTPVWTSGGYYIDADIQFNNVGFTWSLTGAPNTVDTQSIATHEEGHFLGLNHSASSSAIMYASYSGGLKRTLTSDDSSGVCTIYPSGTTPPPDAGMTMMGSGATGSPCTQPTDCTSNLCVSDGTMTFCSSMCTDDCGCPTGFQCFPTTMTGVSVCGPGANTCSTGHDSGSTMTAGGQIGDPCAGATECASGICAHASGAAQGFCTRTCGDDCTCPGGFQCFPTTTTGTNVCGPGTNTCVHTSDAGISVDAGSAGHDGGSTTGTDAGAADARRDSGGDGGPGTNSGGCACGVPGAPASEHSLAWLGGLVAAVVVGAGGRRRRRG